MHLHSVSRFALFLGLLVPTVMQASTLTIEQASTFGTLGKWTLIQPTQQSVDGTADRVVLTAQGDGRYTLIATPPAGTSTTISVYRGTSLHRMVDVPQVSFVHDQSADTLLQISFALTQFGIVGVNSEPSGIPFELKGPDDLIRTGVTPAVFEGMPHGNYSVRYQPTGCNEPPQRSDDLEAGKSVYFSFSLQCSTFRPIETQQPKHVMVDHAGGTFTFVDVPRDAWFTPYVETVARRGIITGYRDDSGNATGVFGPANPVTLGELSKIGHVFGDIDPQFARGELQNRSAMGKWFTSFIVSAEQRGWSVFQNPSSDLQSPATRGQVVATLLQVMDEPARWPRGGTFDDVLRNTPYAGAIETAAALKLVSGVNAAEGTASATFAPQAPITRAELSKLLVTFAQYRDAKKSASLAR